MPAPLPALLVAGLLVATAPAAHAVTVDFASTGTALPVNLVVGTSPVGFDIVFPTPNVYQDPPATGPGNVPPPGTPRTGTESRSYAYELTAVTLADLGNVSSSTRHHLHAKRHRQRHLERKVHDLVDQRPRDL